LYTIEELSYFLQNYLYLIDDTFFDSGFLLFLRDGLGRQDLFELVNYNSGKVEPLLLAGKLAGEIGDLSRTELSALTKKINEFRKLSPEGRIRMQADVLLERGEYAQADGIYDQLLTEYEQDNRKGRDSRNRQEQGFLYYQKGRISMALFEWEKAGSFFVRAYEILKKEEILQVLFELSRISSIPVCSEEIFRSVPAEQLARWENAFQKCRAQIEEEADRQISPLYDVEDESEDFYLRAEELTGRWQQDYRKICKY
ncbi:MAG: hypothetical protein MR487_06425, partial [Lachnospiraceae bacterium]|nr:hypothetical protein [Lachnospiraceae bacterium]